MAGVLEREQPIAGGLGFPGCGARGLGFEVHTLVEIETTAGCDVGEGGREGPRACGEEPAMDLPRPDFDLRAT